MQKTNTVHKKPHNALGLDEVLALLKDEIERAGSARKWAMQHGVSNTLISDTVNRKLAPAEAILSALELKRVTLSETYYVPG